MRKESMIRDEISQPKPTYIQQLPKRKPVKDRKKIRQLLRSMLPMEEEQRQLQEEQNLIFIKSKAQ